jgi:hypothetical protein
MTPSLGPEAVARGYDEPHRAGQAFEHPHARGAELVELDIDLGVLVSAHPCSQAEQGGDRKEQPPAAEHLPDRLMACRTGHTDRKSVHDHRPQDAVRVPVCPMPCQDASEGPAHQQGPVW